jgi:hypothetical protein
MSTVRLLSGGAIHPIESGALSNCLRHYCGNQDLIKAYSSPFEAVACAPGSLARHRLCHQSWLAPPPLISATSPLRRPPPPASPRRLPPPGGIAAMRLFSAARELRRETPGRRITLQPRLQFLRRPLSRLPASHSRRDFDFAQRRRCV